MATPPRHLLRSTSYYCPFLQICRKAHLHTQSADLVHVRKALHSVQFTVPPIVQSSPLLVRSRGGVGIGIPRYCFVFPFGADVGRVMNDQDHRELRQTPQPPDLRGTLIANPQPPSFGGFIPLATGAGAGKRISLLP